MCMHRYIRRGRGHGTERESRCSCKTDWSSHGRELFGLSHFRKSECYRWNRPPRMYLLACFLFPSLYVLASGWSFLPFLVYGYGREMQTSGSGFLPNVLLSKILRSGKATNPRQSASHQNTAQKSSQTPKL